MYRIVLAFLLSHLALSAAGQVIKGTVLEQETRDPIPLASVFFDGTFVGTSTDEQGRFVLDVGNYLTRPLTISAVGYHPHLLKDLDPGLSYVILLARDIYEIEEVQITGKEIARKRKEYLRLFKREFIGLTPNARNCYILNEEDITFNYESDRDTIRAMARKPLHIENHALGYDLIYHLENFEFDRQTQLVSYTGSIVFTRDLAREGIRTKLFDWRRRITYKGSGKEFIRELWKDSLKSSGYNIQDYYTGELLGYKDVVVQDEQGNKYLQYPDILTIAHYYDFSRIRLLKDKVFFDHDGFFDPAAIMWSGKMGSQRIADFLPYEYTVER